MFKVKKTKTELQIKWIDDTTEYSETGTCF